MLLEFDGTFIFALVSFIIFTILMNLILYKPVMKVITERQKYFEKNQNTVTNSKQKAQEALKEKNDTINYTKKDAQNMLAETASNAKTNKIRAIKTKTEDMKRTLLEQNEVLSNEQLYAKREIKWQIEEFVKNASKKLIAKDVEVKIDNAKLDKILKIES